MYIYQIKNKLNGKCYIGQTIKNPEKRWKKHIAISNREYHKDSSCIHSALKKYGIENFDFSVLCTVNTREELDIKEKYYIKQLNTLVPNGYNISSGGQFSKEIDIYTRQKISESKKGSKNPNWHKVLTDEEKAKHREMMIKRYSDPKERAKTGLKSKEVWKRPGFKEKMHLIKINQFSDEVKKQIGAKSKSIWSNPDFKTKMSAKRKEIWADPEFRKKWYLARYNKVINEKI